MKQGNFFPIVIFLSAFLAFSYPHGAKAFGEKYKEALAKIALLESKDSAQTAQLAESRDSLMILNERNDDLNTRLKEQKESYDEVASHMKDLVALSGTQAESINKSFASMGVKDTYIKNVKEAVSRGDSVNMALVINFKNVMGDLSGSDININIEKNMVYIDMPDKALFKKGGYEVTDSGKDLLGKVSKVLLAHPESEFIVEGNTDNTPFHEGALADNWDLSVKQATSVVRILQNDDAIPPAKMTAAGRSEYAPLTDNNTEAGKEENRRMRIIIMPQMGQLFKLLEKPAQ